MNGVSEPIEQSKDSRAKRSKVECCRAKGRSELGEQKNIAINRPLKTQLSLTRNAPSNFLPWRSLDYSTHAKNPCLGKKKKRKKRKRKKKKKKILLSEGRSLKKGWCVY